MSEAAENKFEDKQENNKSGNQEHDFFISRLSVFVLKSRIYIIMQQRRNDIELKNKCKSERKQETDHIKCPFSHNSSDQFLCRNFFIPGQNGAFYNFTQTGCTEVDKITDHNS